MASPRRDEIATVDLHRDAVFTLLLQVEPKELNKLCRSHRKFANVCREPYFREMYKAKWSKRLIPIEAVLAKLREMEPSRFSKSKASELKTLGTLSLKDIRGIEIMPAEICSLTNLKTLRIYTSTFRKIPAAISNLAKLRELLFYRVDIVTLPPEIGELISLKQLTINRCSSFETLPPEIGNLPQLQELAVVECRLQTVPPEVGNISTLKSLNVALNRISLSLPEELLNLSNLEELIISGPIAAATGTVATELRRRGVTVTDQY